MREPRKTELAQYLLDEGMSGEDFRHRLNAHINQKTNGPLAARRRVDQSVISLWRRGRSTPSLDYAVAIEKVTDGKVPVESWASRWALGE